ncbi:hypothetical protein CYLTODRAFT_421494 [Cylindrobasidium torrendii FP15055 ss-10]|uniref:Uncharacterized protein n=1 Tax=Cylindrobasidium torrendii FP15055 ss-10 TaxID=1314674 RepID=A0A0D7BFZ6_9AGAR|nr:hypothetical protein CYLTODRAFT_421494 [Cylindrobasidium torrendii FP15055 ss-10]
MSSLLTRIPERNRIVRASMDRAAAGVQCVMAFGVVSDLLVEVWEGYGVVCAVGDGARVVSIII